MYDAFSKVGNFRDISPFGFHRSLTGSWRAQLARPPDRLQARPGLGHGLGIGLGQDCWHSLDLDLDMSWTWTGLQARPGLGLGLGENLRYSVDSTSF